MEISVENLKAWRESLLIARFENGSASAELHTTIILHEINSLIGDGKDVDHIVKGLQGTGTIVTKGVNA